MLKNLFIVNDFWKISWYFYKTIFFKENSIFQGKKFIAIQKFSKIIRKLVEIICIIETRLTILNDNNKMSYFLKRNKYLEKNLFGNRNK